MPAIVKDLPPIPAERALKVIGGRWKVIILYYLFDGPKRLSELRRLVGDVSQKVLVQQLREMEEHGIVHRQIFAQVPPRVDYSATKLGLSLRPILAILCDWGRKHATELSGLDEPPVVAPPASPKAPTRKAAPRTPSRVRVARARAS